MADAVFVEAWAGYRGAIEQLYGASASGRRLMLQYWHAP